MCAPDPRRSAGASPAPPCAPSWRFVDRFGTEWRVYDRVRWAPTPSHAEFRFVPPGHRDARSRVFVRADRVVFEFRASGLDRATFSPVDLSDRTLERQLRAARCLGPVYIPAGATTLEREMCRLARDYPGELPPTTPMAALGPHAVVSAPVSTPRPVTAGSRLSEFGYRPH